ncbi:ABC transporter ATP-binding protein [Roseospira marina]|uniref:ABC transporter ATP-binding protein n=1 Tax=Roseospira marina TaxID=140057 RepID=A0A5M6I8M4_9PROT|nr:ABC transporter ATP-binding protein [Roseospira marina]KAA5604165.1 ABC transporter ATP-binding protein [Roseospira marina]MBB4315737.1 lipopolysaccharide transport system ATP-binding protein [Roseospira marina]MBB5088904.1 lipopolysaccharide transport system ATP-binding protein [Roseospira marina]
MSSDPAISVQGLSKCYQIYDRPQDRLLQMLWRGRKQFFRPYWALEDITVEVPRGETLGVLGSNGAGKSTLLQIITGTLTPTAGTVAVNGRVAALLELGAGFNPEFNGLENIHLAASILGLTQPEIDARLDQIIAFAGIGDFLHQPVKLYSSGMYARLAFSVAAHVDADVLIIDEILSVGDAAFTQKCMRFIHRFKEHGTILFVTHDIPAATKLCDRVLWLQSGRQRALGTAKTVCEDYMAAVSESQDEGGTFRIGKARGERSGRPVEADGPAPARRVQDPRHEALKASDHANVLEVFEFDPNADSYGHQGATVTDVALLDREGASLPTLYGGEEVILRVTATAAVDIVNPIVGFYIRDRLGQNLFGDNTYLTTLDQAVTVPAGATFSGEFRFQLPYLSAGDYAITVAVAEGTESDHIHHHWINDAVFFTVLASHFSHGLIGVPMLDIRLDVGRPAGAKD